MRLRGRPVNAQGSFFDTAADVARDVKAHRKAATHRDDPSTSHAAARKVAVVAGTHRANVLLALYRSAAGCTQEELWKAGGERRQTGKYPNHAQTRAEELADLGLARATERRRANDAGNDEQVWEITAAGIAVAAELQRVEAAA